MANEYAVNKDDLIMIADAIRERIGFNGELLFPYAFASAIREIQSGDLPQNIISISSGTFIPASTGKQTIQHNLGDVPNLIIVTRNNRTVKADTVMDHVVFYDEHFPVTTDGIHRYYDEDEYPISNGYVFTPDSISFTVPADPNGKLHAGDSYSWIAMTLRELS